jgi:hypothetical protein
MKFAMSKILEHISKVLFANLLSMLSNLVIHRFLAQYSVASLFQATSLKCEKRPPG